MRLKTIWTISGMRFSERLRRTRDWMAQKIGKHLPLRIRYWVTFQEIGRASIDAPNVPAMSLGDLIKKIEAPKNLS